MKRPNEADYTSQVAYTRALEEYCDMLEQPAPVQEPVATVIEELEHDGEGWCSTVRWLYNPVPVGEILSWGKSK